MSQAAENKKVSSLFNSNRDFTAVAAEHRMTHSKREVLCDSVGHMPINPAVLGGLVLLIFSLGHQPAPK